MAVGQHLFLLPMIRQLEPQIRGLSPYYGQQHSAVQLAGRAVIQLITVSEVYHM